MRISTQVSAVQFSYVELGRCEHGFSKQIRKYKCTLSWLFLTFDRPICCRHVSDWVSVCLSVCPSHTVFFSFLVIIFCFLAYCGIKLKFHVTDTDTDMDILADFARKSACPAYPACHEPDTHDNTRRLVRRLYRHARGALFLAKILARLSDKLSCTRLQNYTIGASVSVSVSVTWN